MTVVVTRNVPDRVRGFLASAMLEIAPGVYTAPRMNAGIRARVWEVLVGWYPATVEASIVMTWTDPSLPGGQGVQVLGETPRELLDYDGIFLARRDLREDELRSLAKQK